MPRDGRQTREKILDAAQKQMLQRGFAGTSVDDIQREAGISRGTFFYHFPTKDHMARALIARYAEADRQTVEEMLARAERLASDPLQQALVFIGLHEEMFEGIRPEEAGCLFASYSYEAGVIDADTHRRVLDSIGHWRSALGDKLAEAMEKHPPVVEGVDPYVLADLGYGILEGGFILRRSMDDPSVMARHLREYRRYVELIFGVADREDAEG